MTKNNYSPGMNICKNKYILCIVLFIFGVVMLLYYVPGIKNSTKIIENYSQTELTEIMNKMDTQDTTPAEQSADLSALLTMDLSGVIKRLFGSKCLAGCRSPDHTNKVDSQCNKSIKSYGPVLECPWRCNMKELDNQKKYDAIFASEMSDPSLKKCSVETEDIDCGGCTPLRMFM